MMENSAAKKLSMKGWGYFLGTRLRIEVDKAVIQKTYCQEFCMLLSVDTL